MACCRNHPSQSFRMLRNEDSQNMKPLSTSKSPETILSTFEAQELDTAGYQAQTHTTSVHRSPGILSLVVLWFYLPWLLTQHFNHLAFFGCHLVQYVMLFARSNLIVMPPSWHLEPKLSRQLSRLFSPSACEKQSGYETMHPQAQDGRLPIYFRPRSQLQGNRARYSYTT